jgi:hypothetical protein
MCLPLLLLTVIASAETKPTWKDHPSLFIERSEVPRILERARKYEWAQATLDGIRRSADKALAGKIEYPPSTGRHAVTYICPDCKEPLKTLSPTQHQCPKCKKIYSGLPYDAYLYNSKHDGLAHEASTLGLAALLFNEPKYARKALDILLGYADRYDSYPLVDNRGGQSASAARISDQTLNESIWLIDIAWAYDLVLGMKVGTEAEHRKVEDKLLGASVETIKRYRAGKSNWQSWHNAGMMAAAVAMRDEKLFDEVLNDPECGFYFQMKNSIGADGMWFEGSWSYHSYSVSALLKTAEAARRSGVDLYACPELKKLLEAPLQAVMPNGATPALNDGMEGSPGGWHYEVAAARWGDPLLQDVVSRMKRSGLDALIIGVEKPKAHKNVLSSTILPASGLALLRRGDQYVSLDFGPHGGGHGHLDKLALNYYTRGQTFAPDVGRGWPYNLPIHQQYYKSTLSHNTVVVDGTPQAQCEGSLESSDFNGHYHVATARADDCYEGVRMRRTVAMSDSWLLDVFEVEGEAEHIYDWVWHGRGDFLSQLSAVPYELKSSQPSYSYLSNVRKGDGSGDWYATWTLPGGKVHALFKGSPAREALLCDAPDNPRTNTLHSVILRDRSKSARFVSLFSLKPMKWEDLPAALGEG